MIETKDDTYLIYPDEGITLTPKESPNNKDYITKIKAIGSYLIKNAESIVGNEKNMSGIYISFDLDPTIVPEITIQKAYIVPDA